MQLRACYINVLYSILTFVVSRRSIGSNFSSRVSSLNERFYFFLKTDTYLMTFILSQRFLPKNKKRKSIPFSKIKFILFYDPHDMVHRRLKQKIVAGSYVRFFVLILRIHAGYTGFEASRSRASSPRHPTSRIDQRGSSALVARSRAVVRRITAV